MEQMGLQIDETVSQVRQARLGEVLKSYHPHGDAAVY